MFYFDCVLQPTCTQVQVYNEAACALVKGSVCGVYVLAVRYALCVSTHTHTLFLNPNGLLFRHLCTVVFNPSIKSNISVIQYIV